MLCQSLPFPFIAEQPFTFCRGFFRLVFDVIDIESYPGICFLQVQLLSRSLASRALTLTDCRTLVMQVFKNSMPAPVPIKARQIGKTGAV